MRKKYLLVCYNCRNHFKINKAKKIFTWDGKDKEQIMLMCPGCKKAVHFSIYYNTGHKTNNVGERI